MKLDFSVLAQPAVKARGQVGTTGTPASTRVCTSPLAQPGAGTTGDKPAAVALVADLVDAVPAACPLVSPACPQVTDNEKLNAGAVSPASPLVPTETTQPASTSHCLTAVEVFPCRLSQADADAAHAEPWSDGACARFVARVSLLMQCGIDGTDADNLAERLHLRDVQNDDRRLCLECGHLAGRRCGNRRVAEVGSELPKAMVTQLQRCPGFTAAS